MKFGKIPLWALVVVFRGIFSLRANRCWSWYWICILFASKECPGTELHLLKKWCWLEHFCRSYWVIHESTLFWGALLPPLPSLLCVMKNRATEGFVCPFLYLAVSRILFWWCCSTKRTLHLFFSMLFANSTPYFAYLYINVYNKREIVWTPKNMSVS